MTIAKLIFGTVCPIIGVLMSNVQLCGGIFLIRDCRKNQSLGQSNPLPWIVGFCNALSWTVYGLIIGDVFITTGNAPGTVVGIFGCISALRLLGMMQSKNGSKEDDKFSASADQVESVLLGEGIIWICVAFATIFSGTAPAQFVGILCMLTSIVLYIAPMSLIVEIVQTKNAVSIYLPQVIANIMCSSVWLLYGIFGVNNLNVYVPNAVGLMFSFMNILLKLIYPSFDPLKNGDDDKSMMKSLIDERSVDIA